MAESKVALMDERMVARLVASTVVTKVEKRESLTAASKAACLVAMKAD